MAIIKCPECGHQISDRAPVCPSCGVEIAGKITLCKNCGEAVFKYQTVCQHCNSQLGAPVPPVPHVGKNSSPTPPIPPTANNTQRTDCGNEQSYGNDNRQKHAKSYRTIIVAFAISVIICSVCFYFYNSAKNDRCQEAYEIAMSSDDPLLLENFLNNYADAPKEQLDSVSSRLAMLRKGDEEWMNAVASSSKAMLEEYIDKHPDSPHRGEALHKIDSLDWQAALAAGSLESFKLYMDEHATGEHIEECKESITNINSKTVQPEEKDAIVTVFRHFFQSINSRNEDGLQSTVSSFLTSFLGKTDATKSDVVTFMHRIYKDDITNMNWRLADDWNIEKKDVGGNQYEYTVSFTATQDIERTDQTKEKSAKYNIKATINTEGKISSMNMVKVLE